MRAQAISAVLGVAAVALMLAVVRPAASPGTALEAGRAAVPTVTATPATPETPATPATPATTATPVAPATPVAARELRYGMRGGDVKALQWRLAALKYYPGAVNGKFDVYTLEAVWAFQEVQGLKVNGVVGPATASALQHPRAYQPRYARGDPVRVEVNLRMCVLVVYRGRAVVLISHISAGGGYAYDRGVRAVTPTGRFRTTVYLRGWVRGALGPMYNPVFFIRIAYAIHGEPTYGPNGGGVPLKAVSHGCVRIPYDIAQFLHTLLKTPGTPVYIY